MFDAKVRESLRARALAEEFASALMAGDVVAAADLFAPAGKLLSADGTEISGREPIGELLSQLTASTQTLRILTGRTVCVETVAMTTQFWERSGPGGPGNARYETSTTARLVFSRGGGGWQILIAAPWG